MAAKRTPEDINLTTALRETARRFDTGQPIDIAELFRLIEALRAQRPGMCAAVTDLVHAAKEKIKQGDRMLALDHFRAAIAVADRPGWQQGE